MISRLRYSYLGILLSGSIIYFPLRCLAPGALLIAFIAGALFVLASGIVLLRREGFRLTCLFGIGVAGLYAGTIIFEVLFSHFFGEAFPKACLFFGVMASYGYIALIGSCVMGFLAVVHKPKYDKDYVIVLGCSISKEGGLRPLLKERTNRAIHFAWEQEMATGKPVYYVPSGGKGSDEIMSEASAMELYIVSHGAEFFEVFPEKESRNTRENMVFSKRVIDSL